MNLPFQSALSDGSYFSIINSFEPSIKEVLGDILFFFHAFFKF